MSLVWDPPVPPWTPPLWHWGAWHDGRYTYIRMLAPDPQFYDVVNDRVLTAEVTDLSLYAIDGTRLHARQLFSFSNRDIDDVSDGDASFSPTPGGTMASYVDTVHADPCNTLVVPGIGRRRLRPS